MQEAMVFRLIAGVAEALQAIHAAGVIHRDLKPSNVLLAPGRAAGDRFRDRPGDRGDPVTRSGSRWGRPHFMSPEQILDLPVTPAIDVFALGSLAAFAAIGGSPSATVTSPRSRTGSCTSPRTWRAARPGWSPSSRRASRRSRRLGPHPARSSNSAYRARPPRPGPTGASPGGPAAIGRTPSLGAWSDHSATVVLPDPAQLLSPVRPRRQRLPIVAGLAAIALAAVVIAIAAASHLAAGRATAGRATAGGATATRHPVTARTPARPHPVVRLSAGRPVTASSVQPDSPWVAANAVDGNLGTRWSSAWSDPQWLEVDLGAAHTLTKVVLDWERAYATAFQIQVSDNGTTWTDIYSTTTGAGGSQALQVQGTGRYVRMYGTQRGTQWGYSLWEFQVFGT